MNSDHRKTDKKIELLAPAGSKESFYAALNSGADAVYLAAQKFGARAYAGNFTYEEIAQCAEISHLYGKKIYLTVNTLVKEKEIPELAEFIESGIPELSDGLIVQDLGAASVIRNLKPNIPLHASTQMSITGPEGAGLLKENGFCRVVPARELSFEEIKDIYDKTGMEIECFIHGAMCYSYSGQCLFSSVLGGRSGNRGRCAQPCRLPYRLSGKNGEDTYPLSLKDMCTLEILPDICNSGVCSLKVEGRMKPPQYVAGVISVYRKYLDKILSGEDYHVEKQDIKKLSELYVRGSLSHGYFDRHNGSEMVTVYSHGYNGSSDTEEINDDLYSGLSLPGFTVSFDASFVKGQNAYLSVSCTGSDGNVYYGFARGDTVSEAYKTATGREDILKSLKKLGNTVFCTDEDHISLKLDSNAFYPLKALNQLRRDAIDDLKKNMLATARVESLDPSDSCGAESGSSAVISESSEMKSVFSHAPVDDAGVAYGSSAPFSILINTKEQADAIRSAISEDDHLNIVRIYLGEELLYTGDAEKIISGLKKINRSDNSESLLAPANKCISVFAALSHIRRKNDDPGKIEKLLSEGKLDGILVRNQEDLAHFGRMYADRIITDSGLYIYNSKASCFLDKYSSLHTFPLELSSREATEVQDNCRFVPERVIYGRAPLMVSANCVRKTLKSCSHEGGFETIIDRKGISFPVKCDCLHCKNIIYNSVPLLIKPEKNIGSVNRIEFTDEDRSKVLDVLKVYIGTKDPSEIKHTTGWQSRPVM